MFPSSLNTHTHPHTQVEEYQRGRNSHAAIAVISESAHALRVHHKPSSSSSRAQRGSVEHPTGARGSTVVSPYTFDVHTVMVGWQRPAMTAWSAFVVHDIFQTLAVHSRSPRRRWRYATRLILDAGFTRDSFSALELENTPEQVDEASYGFTFQMHRQRLGAFERPVQERGVKLMFDAWLDPLLKFRVHVAAAPDVDVSVSADVDANEYQELEQAEGGQEDARSGDACSALLREAYTTRGRRSADTSVRGSQDESHKHKRMLVDTSVDVDAFTSSFTHLRLPVSTAQRKTVRGQVQSLSARNWIHRTSTQKTTRADHKSLNAYLRRERVRVRNERKWTS
jgi:hypothetical protein